MLAIYVFLVAIIIALGYVAATPATKEYFSDVQKKKKDDLIMVKTPSFNYVSLVSKEIEVIQNTELNGSFQVDDSKGNVLLQIGSIGIEYDVFTSKILFHYSGKKEIEIKVPLVQKKSYVYRVMLFPIENYMIFLLDGQMIYAGRNEQVGIPGKTVNVSVKGSIGSISQPNVSPFLFDFLSTKQELFQLNNGKNVLNANGSTLELIDKASVGDKKSVIWNIEQNKGYYTIRNIVSGFYLGVTNGLVLQPQQDKNTKFVILEGKKNIVIFHASGKVIQLDGLAQTNKWIEQLVLKKIDNIGEWINYGSTINVVNSSKQYLSGNLNFKYDFNGSSGLPAVYADNLAEKTLIQWTLESLTESKRGHYVKEGDSVYIKNNGNYLQVIKGNPTPNGIGMEVSLGPEKNNNSKWVIMHHSDKSLLFRKSGEVYFYHPKTEQYLYNTNKSFIISGKDKIETICIDKKNIQSVWIIGNVVSLEGKRTNKEATMDYYKFELDKTYFNNQDKKWKDRLDKENQKIKKNLEKYNKLKENEVTLDSAIIKAKENIVEIQKTKCPPRKLCLNAVDYDCIPQKNEENNDKKKKDTRYDIVYVKETIQKQNPRMINTNEVTKCKTVKDFDITTSEYVKKNEYVPKKGAKLKITDFNFADFPEANDYVSIESIPEDKKITDFKISELPGFNDLELKIK